MKPGNLTYNAKWQFSSAVKEYMFYRGTLHNAINVFGALVEADWLIIKPTASGGDVSIHSFSYSLFLLEGSQ